MTAAEHTDRVARNTLELNQARRQLAAVRAAMTRAADVDAAPAPYRLGELLTDLEAALGPQPAPTSGDPA